MAENSGADGFAPLRVKRVVRETSDAVSLVLDVPESLLGSSTAIRPVSS